MQPSVYDAILPNILLTLTVSTEPVASFFSSSRLTTSSRRTPRHLRDGVQNIRSENGHEKQKFPPQVQTFLEGPLGR
jgi:hypothetical protein